MKITNKEMTELEKISYDIASYVTHEHNKHDIRSLREFIENRIQESKLNKTNGIHNVSESFYSDLRNKFFKERGGGNGEEGSARPRDRAGGGGRPHSSGRSAVRTKDFKPRIFCQGHHGFKC